MPVMDGLETTKRYREYEKMNHYQNTKNISEQTKKIVLSGLKNGNTIVTSNTVLTPASLDSPSLSVPSTLAINGTTLKNSFGEDFSGASTPLGGGQRSDSVTPSVCNSFHSTIRSLERKSTRNTGHSSIRSAGYSSMRTVFPTAVQSNYHQSIIIDDVPINDKLLIIGMSANSDEMQKTAAINAGMNLFLSKPFTADELFAAINEVFSQKTST